MDPNEAIEIVYEIIIIIIIKVQQQETDGLSIGERERRFLFYIFFLFLSQIYGNRTVDFHWSRRQSWSTRRELRVGTKSLAFCHTSRGRKFSYLCYFEPKCYVMA